MRKVESEIIIEASVSAVFNAFVDFQMLKDWWGVERCLIGEKAGGVYSLVWDISESGFKYVFSGRIKNYLQDEFLEIGDVVYFNPEKPLLGPMSLSVKTERANINSTKLTLVQDGYGDGEHWDWYYEAVKDAWPKALHSLKEYLEKSKNPG